MSNILEKIEIINAPSKINIKLGDKWNSSCCPFPINTNIKLDYILSKVDTELTADTDYDGLYVYTQNGTLIPDTLYNHIMIILYVQYPTLGYDIYGVPISNGIKRAIKINIKSSVKTEWINVLLAYDEDTNTIYNTFPFSESPPIWLKNYKLTDNTILTNEYIKYGTIVTPISSTIITKINISTVETTNPVKLINFPNTMEIGVGDFWNRSVAGISSDTPIILQKISNPITIDNDQTWSEDGTLIPHEYYNKILIIFDVRNKYRVLKIKVASTTNSITTWLNLGESLRFTGLDYLDFNTLASISDWDWFSNFRYEAITTPKNIFQPSYLSYFNKDNSAYTQQFPFSNNYIKYFKVTSIPEQSIVPILESYPDIISLRISSFSGIGSWMLNSPFKKDGERILLKKIQLNFDVNEPYGWIENDDYGYTTPNFLKNRLFIIPTVYKGYEILKIFISSQSNEWINILTIRVYNSYIRSNIFNGNCYSDKNRYDIVINDPQNYLYDGLKSPVGIFQFPYHVFNRIETYESININVVTSNKISLKSTQLIFIVKPRKYFVVNSINKILINSTNLLCKKSNILYTDNDYKILNNSTNISLDSMKYDDRYVYIFMPPPPPGVVYLSEVANSKILTRSSSVVYTSKHILTVPDSFKLKIKSPTVRVIKNNVINVTNFKILVQSKNLACTTKKNTASVIIYNSPYLPENAECDIRYGYIEIERTIKIDVWATFSVYDYDEVVCTYSSINLNESERKCFAEPCLVYTERRSFVKSVLPIRYSERMCVCGTNSVMSERHCLCVINSIAVVKSYRIQFDILRNIYDNRYAYLYIQLETNRFCSILLNTATDRFAVCSRYVRTSLSPISLTLSTCNITERYGYTSDTGTYISNIFGSVLIEQSTERNCMMSLYNKASLTNMKLQFSAISNSERTCIIPICWMFSERIAIALTDVYDERQCVYLYSVEYNDERICSYTVVQKGTLFSILLIPARVYSDEKYAYYTAILNKTERNCYMTCRELRTIEKIFDHDIDILLSPKNDTTKNIKLTTYGNVDTIISDLNDSFSTEYDAHNDRNDINILTSMVESYKQKEFTMFSRIGAPIQKTVPEKILRVIGTSLFKLNLTHINTFDIDINQSLLSIINTHIVIEDA